MGYDKSGMYVDNKNLHTLHTVVKEPVHRKRKLQYIPKCTNTNVVELNGP